MDNEIFKNRVDLTAFSESVNQIKSEIGKVIVGQERMIDLLLTAMLSDGHVLLEGVPGVAKTLTAKLMARVIDTDFSRIQFTPDLMPSDILGTSVFNAKSGEFSFKQGPVFSNIILVDEINRAPAKTQSALFEVMEERQVTVDGNTYQMEEPYLVIGTQNPIEQEGTYRLPEAQLDRFIFKIQVEYPNAEEETDILKRSHERKEVLDLSTIRPVLTTDQIREYRQIVRGLLVEDHLFDYITSVVQETRNNFSVFLGASPRASLAILSSAKAFAALRGRDFITPEDIKEVALPVLRHRIILTPEKEMEGADTDEVIRDILGKVKVPR